MSFEIIFSNATLNGILIEITLKVKVASEVMDILTILSLPNHAHVRDILNNTVFMYHQK